MIRTIIIEDDPMVAQINCQYLLFKFNLSRLQINASDTCSGSLPLQRDRKVHLGMRYKQGNRIPERRKL